MAASVLPQTPIAQVASSPPSVTVTDDSGDEYALHFEWLRDNCRCDECRIVQTDERRFRPWELASVSPRSVDAVDGALTIEWNDGHRSSFGPVEFATLSVMVSRG